MEAAHAAASLRGVRAAWVAAPLIAALNDRYPSVRVAAAAALGVLRIEAARAALQRAARDDSAEVRRASQRALTRIGQ